MKSQVSVEQRFAFLAAFGANIDWDEFSPDQIQAFIREPDKMEGTAFMKAGAKMPWDGFIDMDKPSTRIPADWQVRPQDQLPNRACGRMEWNLANTRLHLTEKQQASYDVGTAIQTELGGMKERLWVTDAIVDFYLDNPRIPTPKEWWGKWIVCRGRVYYRSSDVSLVVRGLRCCAGGSRRERWYSLSYDFSSRNPALGVLAGK